MKRLLLAEHKVRIDAKSDDHGICNGFFIWRRNVLSLNAGFVNQNDPLYNLGLIDTDITTKFQQAFNLVIPHRRKRKKREESGNGIGVDKKFKETPGDE